jgi:hypothetical protein
MLLLAHVVALTLSDSNSVPAVSFETDERGIGPTDILCGSATVRNWT